MQTFRLNANGIACFCCIRGGKKAQRRLSSSRCYATKAEALRCPSASKGLFAPPTLVFCSIPASWRCYQRGVRLSAARCFTSTRRRRRCPRSPSFFSPPLSYTHTYYSTLCVHLSVCVGVCDCACTLTQPESACICCLFSRSIAITQHRWQNQMIDSGGG